MAAKLIRPPKLKAILATILTAFTAIATAIAGLWIARSNDRLSGPSPLADVARTVPDLSSSVGDRPATLSLSSYPPPALKPTGVAEPAAPENLGTSEAIAEASGIQQGTLRVRNPSEHPVRVAVLLKKPTAKETASSYEPPAHWDFDPGEGSTKGLLLSLPNRRMKLKTGDVLVAFAQDGSRRYWGPYVVGETPTPAWSAKTAEWQLTLEP
jgi:hypothetical protein